MKVGDLVRWNIYDSKFAKLGDVGLIVSTKDGNASATGRSCILCKVCWSGESSQTRWYEDGELELVSESR